MGLRDKLNKLRQNVFGSKETGKAGNETKEKREEVAGILGMTDGHEVPYAAEYEDKLNSALIIVNYSFKESVVITHRDGREFKGVIQSISYKNKKEGLLESFVIDGTTITMEEFHGFSK